MTPVLVDCADLSVPDDDDENGGSTNDPNAVHDGDPAGGDLVGTYPNPTINPDLTFPGSPVSQDDIDASTNAEAALRAAADTTEASTRASAVTAEAATRASADTGLSNSLTALTSSLTSETTARSGADTTEATARAAADALKVDKDSLHINVQDHGVLPSNSGATNLTNWNTVITGINNGTYKGVYWPPGTYTIAGVPNPITPTGGGNLDNISIFGAGPSTWIKQDASAAGAHGTFFTLGQADGTGAVRYGSIYGFKLSCNATTNLPPAGEACFHLNDGSHLAIRDIVVLTISGLVVVGTHTGTLSGTITNTNASLDRLTTGAAHGLSVGDRVIFTGLAGQGVAAGVAYFVKTVPTTTTLSLSLTNGGTVLNITADSGTGTWTGGGFPARVQRYEVQNIMGTWNENTVGAIGIDIQNGTGGHILGLEVEASDVKGGAIAVRNQPVGNNDLHYFTDVHFQGGHNVWLEIDVTNGDCYNWVFKHAVMDQAESGSIFLHNDSGDGTITDLHFLDCHVVPRSGPVINIAHNGTGDWRSIQFIGGRYRFNNAKAVSMAGTGLANIQGILWQGCSFLQDHISITGTNKTTDVLTSQAGGDGSHHGLSPGNDIVFGGSPPAATPSIAPPTVCTVLNTSDTDGSLTADQFTLKVGATPVNITGDFGASFSGMCRIPTVMQITDVNAARVQGCYFGGFYGTATQALYAIDKGGTPTYYCITGNVARGMVTGFQSGFSTVAGPPQTSVVSNNVTDT